MADFLLIHGSCHGAWCWRDVIPELERLGHTARAIDLPSHGDDTSPYWEVTLDSYADAILDAIDTPVILVGHSMAGFPISAAAEKNPAKVERLVYLCAYAPRAGMSLVDMRREAPRQPLLEAISKTADGLGFTVNPDKVGEVFYHDCPEGTVDYANERLCIQAIKPQDTPITLTARYGSVAKSYIRCMNDRTIPPEYQVTMSEDWPERDVFEMPTGHSPFFADPKGLAARLDEIAKG